MTEIALRKSETELALQQAYAQLPAILTDGHVLACKATMKAAKEYVSAIASAAKELSAPLKAEIDRIKAAEKQASEIPANIEADLRNRLKALELEKDRARQEAARIAAEKAQAEKEKIMLFARRRQELESKIADGIASGKEAEVRSWLQAGSWKAEYYGSDPAEVGEYMATLADRIQAGDFTRLTSASVQAEFAAAMIQQASQQAAPQKSAGTSFKEVWQFGPNASPETFAALLGHYVSTGGSLEKLEFLLRWAEKTRMQPPAGVVVERVPIVRI